jgi:hypothetical protein
MISSRAMTSVFGGSMTLTDVRANLRAALHAIRWAQPTGVGMVGRDQPLFDVWTHEVQSGDTADRSTTQISLDEIDKADVIVVLYTGEAGSAANGREIGICHMELEQALSRRPEIVALVGLEPLVETGLERDQRFREYVARQKLYSPQGIRDYAALEHKVIELLQERVAHLVNRGAARIGGPIDQGQALDWQRLNLDGRREAMRRALARAFGVALTDQWDPERLQPVSINGASLAVRIDAIAGALSNAAARERVGQPFLRDHTLSSQIQEIDAPGVVHVIACHRGITESQAQKILGSPDAMTVATDFGLYALDRVQKVQILFLAKCGNETAVASAARLMGEWLQATGEQARLVANAESRRRILQAIAQESEPKQTGKRSTIPGPKGRRR